ncbi:BA14K-like protein [Devosia enhydra]|uniref:Lectin-like protein BA14k n=1 Tax=Devosia enhydra TaxID=665118 RepID=A0A1K2HVC1_9HYPH|nr:BA14K family protein [Devosia enhydra]SFZ82444.1 BA14K-like protein [Devosia enhydra]
MKKAASIFAVAAMALTSFTASAIPAAAQSFSFGMGSRDGYVNVQSRNFERRGNNYYYNNHRGYRERRPGYRYHNGWWFPPAAFVFGSIVGGAIASGIARESRGGSYSAHVAWCSDRYRSYRASDNTFQPYNGPRQQCISPY